MKYKLRLISHQTAQFFVNIVGGLFNWGGRIIAEVFSRLPNIEMQPVNQTKVFAAKIPYHTTIVKLCICSGACNNHSTRPDLDESFFRRQHFQRIEIQTLH